MTEHLTPVDVLERMIGGPEAIAAAIGADRTLPYAWRRSSKARDAGDIPSARNMRRLLAYAGARGIPLRADHLIWGAPRAEIEALLALRAAAPGPDMPRAAK